MTTIRVSMRDGTERIVRGRPFGHLAVVQTNKAERGKRNPILKWTILHRESGLTVCYADRRKNALRCASYLAHSFDWRTVAARRSKIEGESIRLAALTHGGWM